MPRTCGDFKLHRKEMSRETKITVSAFGSRKSNSEENISISLINLASKFHFSSADQNNFGKQITQFKCSIAVKELIIEWEDYQTEACCFVQCDWIKDQRDYEFDVNGSLIMDESRPKFMKPLLRFVKTPGLKTTFIQIPDEQIIFHSLTLNELSSFYAMDFDEIKQTIHRYQQQLQDIQKEDDMDYKEYEQCLEDLQNFKKNSGISGGYDVEQIIRNHDIVLHVKPLFDENAILPIKYAHLTAEVHMTYP